MMNRERGAGNGEWGEGYLTRSVWGSSETMMVVRCRQRFLFALLTALLALAGACSSGLSGRRAGGGTGGSSRGSAASTENSDGSEPLAIVLYLMSRCPHCANAVAALVPIARDLGDSARRHGF